MREVDTIQLKRPFVRINGVEIYYEVIGQPLQNRRPVLAMVHGYLSSLFSYRLLTPLLEDDFTILIFDLPGFGKSEKSKTYKHSLDNYAVTLIQLLETFNMSKVNVVGHSMGGQIGLRAARLAPTMIERLIGLAPAGYMGPVKKSMRMATRIPAFPFFLRLYFKRYNVLNTFLEVTYDKTIVNKEMMDGYIEPLKEKAFYNSLTRLIQDREGDLSSEDVSQITQPILLLWGKEDRIVPLEIGERFAKDLPQATLKIYKETGHLLPEEKPDEVAQAIRDFLKQGQDQPKNEEGGPKA
jgi:pimeloyl-ACP methyl ester carboxylesterase